MQRALIQYRNPKNYYLVREALQKAHREDLIGSGPKCLIRVVPPKACSAKVLPKAPPKPSVRDRKPAAKAPVKKAAPIERKAKGK